MRRIEIEDIWRLFHCKLRPDTPQLYEYITIEDARRTITGSMININPWTQFFDLKGRVDKPKSRVENIVIKDCNVNCECFFNVSKDDKEYKLKNFTLKNLQIFAKVKENCYNVVENIAVENVLLK